MSSRKYVGFDVHSATISAAVRDASGQLITESVFNWPGIGTLLLQAIQQRDYGIVQGVVLFISIVFMTVNLLVDLTYAYLDPRIHYQ